MSHIREGVDIAHFQNFWIEQQKTAVHMPQELAAAAAEKFIKENYYDVKYFHGNPYYEFGSDLTLEWEFILIEKGYKIFVDCESGFLVVTKRTDK